MQHFVSLKISLWVGLYNKCLQLNTNMETLSVSANKHGVLSSFEGKYSSICEMTDFTVFPVNLYSTL